MNKKIKLLSLVLLLGVMLSLLAVAVFAEGEEEKVARVDRINEMGYNFPPEGDTEIPKYKIIYPDGTEYISYVITDMRDDSVAAPSGSTFVLMSDLYLSNSYVKELRGVDPEVVGTDVYKDRQDDAMSFAATNEKTLNFDFAGHTMFSEFKVTFFSVTGASKLNVYSSEPGARMIMLEEGKDTGGAVITISSGVANIGDLCDEEGNIIYPGENLSTYSAGGFVVAGGVLNVSGVTAYRVATDYVSYFSLSGANGKANFTRSRFFGVGRYLQIACREDGGNTGRVYNTVFTFEDCVISNIGSPGVVTGAFFRYMADDNAVYFKNVVFDTVSFACEKYYEHDGLLNSNGDPKFPNAKTAIVSFDERCSYNQLPDVNSMTDKAENSSKFEMYQFPELAEGYGVRGSGAPEYILSDGRITDVVAIVFDSEYKAANGIHDFSMHDLLEDWDDLSGMFTLPYKGYEEDVVEVTWEYNGVTSEPELWLKGETPTPYTINVPRDTEYIKYNIVKIYEEGNYAFYTVTPEVNLSVKMNFTLGDKAYINVYVPVYEDMPINDLIYRMSVGGNVTKINDITENAEIVDIDGQQYYKIVTPVEYSRITDKIVFTIDVPNASKTAKAFTITKRIEFTSMMKGYIEGDGSESFKKSIGDVLYYIYKISSAPTAIQEINDYVTANFADRIEADRLAEEAAKNEAQKNESFIDKILGKIKK